MKHTILITNDDGIDAPGIDAIIRGLNDAGYPIIVCAPDRERSASTMHLTLHKSLKLRRRNDLEKIYSSVGSNAELYIFDVSGYPADCVMVALEGGLPSGIPKPSLCVSGINRGPNMSVDILHSGTIGAARQAGTCGLPAISTSLASFDVERTEDFAVAVEPTLELVRRVCKIIPIEAKNIGRPEGTKIKSSGVNNENLLRNSIINGDIFLNLNVPINWGGEYSSTHLGGRWYRDAMNAFQVNENEWTIKLGSLYIVDEEIKNGDSHRVKMGEASVSTLGTWPQGHPLSISDEVLQSTINELGIPSWLVID
tara:strand:+ start:298 stop:1230 length:933 start_codon:yes stop_codon:yes gene_type:complete